MSVRSGPHVSPIVVFVFREAGFEQPERRSPKPLVPVGTELREI